CCGLFGLKAQRDRIATAPLGDIWNGLGVYGFLTRSVADSALLYEVATGRPYVAAARREPGRLRVALSLKIPPGVAARLGSEQRRATHETAELLRSLGHEVIERNPSYGLIGRNVMVRYVAGANIEAQTMAHPARMEPRTRGMVRMGAAVKPLLRRAIAAQDADARRINRIFEDVDVVLTPTLSCGPLPIGRYDGCGALQTFNGAAGFVAFNPLFNHIGNPAAAIPAGFDGDGLPLSAQLGAAPDGEETLLSLAAQLEAARPWGARRPPIS
ncbi:MAG: amidase family protein, partial [Solirubrobacteraceae bacterium]